MNGGLTRDSKRKTRCKAASIHTTVDGDTGGCASWRNHIQCGTGFFLVRPDNLSVLSADGIRARVNALANLLRAEPAVELLVVDSRESFQRNKEFYQARLEEERLPALRELLAQDIRHLDEILSSSASAREFVLILRRDLKSDMNEGTLRQLEKGICDHGLHVRLADEQDVKRLLAVYYQHDVTTDFFEDVDGGKAVIQNGK